jgi:hypothetical protein
MAVVRRAGAPQRRAIVPIGGGFVFCRRRVPRSLSASGWLVCDVARLTAISGSSQSRFRACRTFAPAHLSRRRPSACAGARHRREARRTPPLAARPARQRRYCPPSPQAPCPLARHPSSAARRRCRRLGVEQVAQLRDHHGGSRAAHRGGRPAGPGIEQHGSLVSRASGNRGRQP